MAKLISSKANIGQSAKLEHPVRVFSYGGVQNGAEIGRYTIINRHAFISGRTQVGRFCSIGRGAEVGVYEFPLNLLSNHPFQYNTRHFEEVPGYTKLNRNFKADLRHTYIGHDVMIDAKAIIKAGVAIGIGAVVGAGSGVVDEVPPYAVVEGFPAQVIGYRFDQGVIDMFLASRWWELTPKEMEGMAFDDPHLVVDQIAEALEKKQKNKAKKAPVEKDHPVLVGLKQSLTDMGMGKPIIKLVMEDGTYIANTFDPNVKADQVILQNKLAYLQQFVAERGQTKLSANEKKHIAGVFRQKS